MWVTDDTKEISYQCNLLENESEENTKRNEWDGLTK